MITLHSEFLREVQRMSGTQPLVWIYKFVIDRNSMATPVFRLTPHPQEVTYAGEAYRPFPVHINGIDSNIEGNLPSSTVALSNVTRIVSQQLFSGAGMRGMPVTVRVAPRSVFEQLDGPLTFDFSVRTASITNETVSLELQAANPNDGMAPQERFNRRLCDHVFGDANCGYRLNVPGNPFPTCPKTVAACRERGDFMASQGFARMWPRQFGGDPGIPIA